MKTVHEWVSAASGFVWLTLQRWIIRVFGFATIMLLVMGIAFLAGTLPARRASRQNPIDALRYE